MNTEIILHAHSDYAGTTYEKVESGDEPNFLNEITYSDEYERANTEFIIGLNQDNINCIDLTENSISFQTKVKHYNFERDKEAVIISTFNFLTIDELEVLHENIAHVIHLYKKKHNQNI